MSSLSGTQTVYRLLSTAPRQIKPFQEPIPQTGPGEVLVKVKSVSLNYRDLVILSGEYPRPAKEGVVPCSDASGIIVSVGSEVESLAVGDKVIGNFNIRHMYGPSTTFKYALGADVDGALREYMVFQEMAVTKIPDGDGHSWDELAGLPCAGVTAWNCLYGNIPLKPGQTVLLQGTGGVSLMGLALAKAAGAKTIVTSSSDEKLAKIKREYGVDYGINYKKTSNWAAEALEITGGRGVDYIIENGGAGTIKQSLECVAYGGQITIVGFLAGNPEEMPNVAMMALYKGCIVRGILVGSKQLSEELVRAVCAQNIRIPLDEKSFGFAHEEVMRAFERLKSGNHTGKVCIKVDSS